MDSIAQNSLTIHVHLRSSSPEKEIVCRTLLSCDRFPLKRRRYGPATLHSLLQRSAASMCRDGQFLLLECGIGCVVVSGLDVHLSQKEMEKAKQGTKKKMNEPTTVQSLTTQMCLWIQIGTPHTLHSACVVLVHE